MTISTLERPGSREQAWADDGSPARALPAWPDPGRPAPARPGEPMAVVIPLRRGQAIPARPVRLTRRGRLTLTLAAIGCLLVVAVGAEWSTVATDQPAAPPATSVVVAPGDTLWSVAVDADPQADPRVMVARIIELNGLAGAQIRPGQTLQLPTH